MMLVLGILVVVICWLPSLCGFKFNEGQNEIFANGPFGNSRCTFHDLLSNASFVLISLRLQTAMDGVRNTLLPALWEASSHVISFVSPATPKMGAGFERLAKSDPSIRLAIGHLSQELPNLYASVEEGQEHVLNTDVGQIFGKFRNGEITGGHRKLQDGSLLVPSVGAETHIQNILAKDGLTRIEIQKALEIYKNAEVGQKVDLSPNISTVQHTPKYGGPKFDSGEPLNPLVTLKIAYEFAALITGTPILESQFPFQEVRRCLIEQRTSSDAFNIERLDATDYKSFHGIAFEGNSHIATFQVRLFGKLAYRVKFAKVAINISPCTYTHDLKLGTDDFRVSESKANVAQ